MRAGVRSCSARQHSGPWAPAPAYVRNAFSSSGELNWFTWEDYAPQPLIDRFQADTGIKLNVTTYQSNEDCLNKLKAASGGTGWDIASPSIGWISSHIDTSNLAALDEKKIPNLGNIFPNFMTKSETARCRARRQVVRAAL